MKLNNSIKYQTIKESVSEPISFENFCNSNLGVVPFNVVIDDKIHRFGEKKKYWYVLHESKRGTGTIYGYCGDWSSFENKEIFFCSKDTGLTLQEKEDLKITQIRIEQFKKVEQEEKRKEMLEYYEALPIPDSHPYLEKKEALVMSDLRVDKSSLVIPLYNNKGEIQSLQRIKHNGDKSFFTGLPTSGVRYIFYGESDKPTFLCEGYATGSSIFEATNSTVICAMNAGNLPKVAKDYKGAIIVADNDGENGAGEEYAKKCEGCDYILIPEVGKDANDYANEHGLDKLKELLLPAQKKRKNHFILVSDLLEEPKFSPYLIKKMFSKGQIGVMVGESGSGKTFTALDMALSLSSGLPTWKGHRCHKANVFYLCGEGQDGIKKRIRAWSLEHNKDKNELGHFSVLPEARDLTNINDVAFINQEIEDLKNLWGGGIDLIIIDTYNQYNSGDENAADAAHAFLANVRELAKEDNPCIMMIHHTGVGADAQKRVRGSSVITGAADFIFLVEKDKDNEQFLSLSTLKQKDIEIGEPMGFMKKQIHLGWYDPDGEEDTSLVLVSREGEAAKIIISPTFEIYSLFKDYWVKEQCHTYVEDNDYWLVPRGDLEDFVMLYERVKNNKEITRETAYRSLQKDRKIGKLLGDLLQKGDTNYWYVRLPKLYKNNMCSGR